jgi:hypothetical protein
LPESWERRAMAERHEPQKDGEVIAHGYVFPNSCLASAHA